MHPGARERLRWLRAHIEVSIHDLNVAVRGIFIAAPSGAQVPLGQVASLDIAGGPATVYREEGVQPGLPTTYLNGSVLYWCTPESNVKLFGGQQRGGRKCTNGVCKVFPPSEGVRAELTMRFWEVSAPVYGAR